MVFLYAGDIGKPGWFRPFISKGCKSSSRWSGFFAEFVITSYSIHYTKLYDLRVFWSMVCQDALSSEDHNQWALAREVPGKVHRKASYKYQFPLLNQSCPASSLHCKITCSPPEIIVRCGPVIPIHNHSQADFPLQRATLRLFRDHHQDICHPKFSVQSSFV